MRQRKQHDRGCGRTGRQRRQPGELQSNREGRERPFQIIRDYRIKIKTALKHAETATHNSKMNGVKMYI